MTTVQGIAASPGIGIGPIHIIDPEEIEVPDHELDAQDVALERERFRAAIRESLAEVHDLRGKIALETGEEQAKILDAQIEILEDPDAIERTLAAVERERRPGAFFFRKSFTAGAGAMRMGSIPAAARSPCAT